MASLDRPKKRIQLWKKAAVHFALCFVTGFFTGFAPTSTVSLFARRESDATAPPEKIAEPGTVNRNLMDQTGPPIRTGIEPPSPAAEAGRQLIVVTTTRAGDRAQEAMLRRLSDTLRLVAPPLLWIVVQAGADVAGTAEVLRRTGLVYRHLAFKADVNFTDAAAEDEHQKNVALSHIEHHRLAGIVHFAGADNVYDLRFFEEIRKIEVFGAWPVAKVSANRKRVVVEGPICNCSSVVGWLSRDFSSNMVGGVGIVMSNADMKALKPPKIHTSGFAFNSSILWDPERWGRATSVPDTSQDSVKFVQEVLLDDVTKLKGISCSKIMLWLVHAPKSTSMPFQQNQQKNSINR